jgi:TolB-like protein/class 3 adenylate cyclase/Tfp pilus assembly protein PilF
LIHRFNLAIARDVAVCSRRRRKVLLDFQKRVNAQSTSAETKPDLPLEIAHLLLIDVVGYSKLLVNEQVELLQELNRIVRDSECFRDAEASGKLIRVPTGDGMALLFFRSPEEPVRCALEIGKALQTHSQIQIRMGVHSGPVNPVKDVNDQTNIAGSGINVAQRVLDCADAGHILLSGHVAEDLAQYRHWQPYLNDLGEYEVKHGLRLHLFNLCKDGLGNPQIPEKLRHRRWGRQAAVIHAVSPPRWPRLLLVLILAASAIALAVSLAIFLRRASPNVAQSRAQAGAAASISEKSIAVLPFENRSEEKANAYFADGIQDEILARLSKIADLKVISRTSTQHYQSAPENLREIANKLGVANILEGSVQKAADQVRVNVQLINAQTDSHLWAEIYDRKLTDIFGVESEIAKAIADQLRAQLTGQEETVITAKPTDDPEAYDAYLRGLAYTLKTTITPANYLAAQKYLKEAVRLDPKFALAWALLSYTDSVGYSTATLQPTLALREEARRAVETALALHPNLGEALMAKGYYYYACLKDYDTAASYLEQARPLLPNDSRISESLAYVTRRRGEWDRSESYFNEAERLDPRNVNLLTQHALSYISLRRFPEALRKLDQVLNITPDDFGILAVKATIAQAEGDLPRAAAFLTSAHSNPDDSSTLGTRIYQAILERSPAQIIPRVKEELARADPADFHTGELRLWLGWAQKFSGDHAGAQESWRQARSELDSFLKEQPENWNLIEDLAMIDAGLGDKTAALALLERAIAAVPIEKDALDGPVPIEILARVAAQVGEPDRAISALQKLLSIPSPSLPPVTPALLRLDPMYDPLRNDPRFQSLCEQTSPRSQ